MKCPNCNHVLTPTYITSDNIDGGTSEYYSHVCCNFECPSRTAFLDKPEGAGQLRVTVDENMRAYHIPFKFKNEWYILNGPVDYIDGIRISEFVQMHRGSNDEPWLHHTMLLKLPFHSLPTDETFNVEFDKLKERLIKIMVLV